ncbi:MAG TPA: glycosyltransferase family 1 protein [Candidatus Xenobia bacterium]|jgi:glycosyltransferase involved in cell wall biosynthesis
MRVALDASFLLLNQASGMKTYTRDLLNALLESRPEVSWVCWYNVFRSSVANVPSWSSPTCDVVCRLPRRLLEGSWRRLAFPPIDWFTGPIDIFHAVHLQVPPVRHARTVLTIHDLREFRLPHLYPRLQGLRAWRRQMAAQADHVITISEATRRDIVEFFQLPPERVSVAHNGLASQYLNGGLDRSQVEAILERLGLAGVPYVLTVSSRDPRKDVPTALRAMRRWQEREPDLLLVLVGPLPAGAAAGEGVRHLGFVDDPVLQALMQGAQVFLLPSLYEGFGLPVLEAQASGVPVVACNVSALPEVAGSTAILVPPGDDEAMADAVYRLLTDTELRTRLVAAGSTRARSFTWKAHGEKVYEVYRQLTGSR